MEYDKGVSRAFGNTDTYNQFRRVGLVVEGELPHVTQATLADGKIVPIDARIFERYSHQRRERVRHTYFRPPAEVLADLLRGE